MIILSYILVGLLILFILSWGSNGIFQFFIEFLKLLGMLLKKIFILLAIVFTIYMIINREKFLNYSFQSPLDNGTEMVIWGK